VKDTAGIPGNHVITLEIAVTTGGRMTGETMNIAQEITVIIMDITATQETVPGIVKMAWEKESSE
jgi:hypothetical protein